MRLHLLHLMHLLHLQLQLHLRQLLLLLLDKLMLRCKRTLNVPGRLSLHPLPRLGCVPGEPTLLLFLLPLQLTNWAEVAM